MGKWCVHPLMLESRVQPVPMPFDLFWVCFGPIFDRLCRPSPKDPAVRQAFVQVDRQGALTHTQYASHHHLLLDTHDSLRFERSRWRIDPLLL